MTFRRLGPGATCLFLALLCAGGAAADEGLYLTDPSTGREVRVDDGEPLLHLAFFATWCPDCLAELDRLGDLEDRYGGRGYRLVLVAVKERQTEERLRRFVANRVPPGRVLFDPSGKLAERLKVGQVPTHVLLDAEGVEILRIDNAADAVDAIEERLGGPRTRGARK